MFNYGILSTATIIDRFIAVIRESNEGVVKAIASRSLDKAKKAAKRLNIETYYGSYEELFKDESIDIIYIPTINSSHYQDCKNALLHKKHVIMEKPFTLTSSQAKELIEIARNNQCFLMEGQKSVFLPTTTKLKELLQSHIIGNLTYIEYKASFPCPYDKDYWMYNLKLGGGCLYGSATYTIETLQYLLDNPCLSIAGNCIRHESGIDTLVHMTLNINNTTLATSSIIMNTVLKNEAVFYGTKGYIVVPYYWKSQELHIYMNDGNYEHFKYPYKSEFVYEILHAHKCIRQNMIESPIMTHQRTLECVSLVEELQNKM